jgi:glucose-6-phosphate-specific signal transduction histidine kinase
VQQQQQQQQEVRGEVRWLVDGSGIGMQSANSGSWVAGAASERVTSRGGTQTASCTTQHAVVVSHPALLPATTADAVYMQR